jgi:hypothetical protein
VAKIQGGVGGNLKIVAKTVNQVAKKKKNMLLLNNLTAFCDLVKCHNIKSIIGATVAQP